MPMASPIETSDTSVPAMSWLVETLLAAPGAC